jgi:spore germination protein YaaH
VTNDRPRVLGPLTAGLLAGLTLAGLTLAGTAASAVERRSAPQPASSPAVLAAANAPAAGDANPPAAGRVTFEPPAPVAGVQPSIHYEEAASHANDPVDFRPGGRVEVGFRPRAGDTWTIGGRAPRALPAGNATSEQILVSPQGGIWADRPPAGTAAAAAALAPLDGEILDPSQVLSARSAAALTILGEQPVAPAGIGLGREVFGFLPYWELSDSSTSLRYDLLSTIAYFGVGVDGGGNLTRTNADGSTTPGWSGWASSRLTNVINAAHQAGTRVVLTIQSFAWTTNQANTQAALLGSSSARLNLARQAAAAVRDRGADGINLDFEPIVSGYADEFTALVRTIRAELDAITPGYQLTFDTTGWISNYPVAEATAPGGADAIFIMGYDYRTASASTAGSISPLTGPIYDLTDTIAAYTARVPASRLILGVPWYGRAWSTSSDTVRSTNISSATNGESVAVMYTTALDFAAQYGRRYDGVEQAPWTVYRKTTCNPTCVTTWRQLYYDDVESLGAKYDLVNRSGLRGVGIWALGFDDTRTELKDLLAGKFQRDGTPPLAGIRALPPTSASRDIGVSWVGLDDRGIRDYDVEVSVDGGPWQSWLPDTTATSATYAGAAGHGFAFRVRATDTSGNVAAWIDTRWSASPSLTPGGFGRVVASSVNIRSGPSTSAGIVGTATSGVRLAITGGPVTADGYSWFQVSLPVEEWGTVSPITSGVWIAAGTSTTPFIAAAQAPNATTVDGGATSGGGARYTGVTPVRLLDTRYGNGLSGAFTSGAVRTFQVAGRGGVPAEAVAVSGNLTTTGSTSGGWVTLGPSLASMPQTSTLNFPRADNRAAGVTVALGAGGTLSAVFQGAPGSTTHLLFDVSGYFLAGTAGATFVPLDPSRVLDSRYGNGLSGPFSSQVPRTFQVSGRGGLPADAVAVTANVTVTRQTSAGYLALGPSVSASPTTSVLNAPAGDDRANGVTVPLGQGGTLAAVWVGGYLSKVDVILDVTGYYVNDGRGASYFSLVPVRLLDSRIGNGLSGPFTHGTPRSFTAAGRGTIPVDALALSGTLTITEQTSAGYLSLGPTMSSSPSTSTLNAPRGDNRANGVTVRAGPAGSLAVVWVGDGTSTTHAIFDATGYFR